MLSLLSFKANPVTAVVSFASRLRAMPLLPLPVMTLPAVAMQVVVMVSMALMALLSVSEPPPSLSTLLVL